MTAQTRPTLKSYFQSGDMPVEAEFVDLIDSLVLPSELAAKQDLASKDQANGYAGLDSSGSLVGTIVLRKGTAAVINAIVLADGEVAFVTDLKEIRLGDGVTSGGLFFGSTGWKWYSNPWPALTTSRTVLFAIPVVSGGTYEYWLQMHASDARTVTVDWQTISAVNNGMISPMSAYGGVLGHADSAVKDAGTVNQFSANNAFNSASFQRQLVAGPNSSSVMRGFANFTGLSSVDLSARVDVNASPAGTYLFGTRRIA